MSTMTTVSPAPSPAPAQPRHSQPSLAKTKHNPRGQDGANPPRDLPTGPLSSTQNILFKTRLEIAWWRPSQI